MVVLSKDTFVKSRSDQVQKHASDPRPPHRRQNYEQKSGQYFCLVRGGWGFKMNPHRSGMGMLWVELKLKP